MTGDDVGIGDGFAFLAMGLGFDMFNVAGLYFDTDACIGTEPTLFGE
jgi:hypothetical protein